jgi:hypothetical protein
VRWFLWQRPNGRFYACRHDRAARQVRRHALGTSDAVEAETLFHRYVVEHAELRAASPDQMTVATCIERYWLQHGQHVVGADVQRRALRSCLEEFGPLTVAELTPATQQAFIHRQKASGHGEPYIKRTLGAVRAALGWVYKRAELTAVPYILTGELRDSQPRERVLEVEELVALWQAIDNLPLARFLALLVGTAGRPGAVVDLTPYQVDVLRRRIDLQPPGEAPTGKRNPILPICDARARSPTPSYQPSGTLPTPRPGRSTAT